MPIVASTERVPVQDAYATARWMADMAKRGALSEYLSSPPLSELEKALAGLEGWILGVR